MGHREPGAVGGARFDLHFGRVQSTGPPPWGPPHKLFDQCLLGSLSTKPTRILHFGLDLTALEGRCNHESSIHEFKNGFGRWVTKFAKHPPLVGRERVAGKFITAA